MANTLLLPELIPASAHPMFLVFSRNFCNHSFYRHVLHYCRILLRIILITHSVLLEGPLGAPAGKLDIIVGNHQIRHPYWTTILHR